MDRKLLQTLAKERLKDARALLGRKRWSAAYYFSGYVIECGLKFPVPQRLHPADLALPYTPEEKRAVERLEAVGMSAEEAKLWVWKKREKEREARSIPAGTIVKANYAAYWGDKPEDDPNPLLQVEAGNGGQGLTFLDNTEPT